MYLLSTLLLVLLYVSGGINGEQKKHCPNQNLMHKCIDDAEQHWEVDRNEADKVEGWCCFRRQYFECQLAVGEECDGYDRKMFDIQMNYTRASIDADCQEYPQSKCTGLEWWAITLIVIACVAVLAILAFGIFMVFVRRKKRYTGKQ